MFSVLGCCTTRDDVGFVGASRTQAPRARASSAQSGVSVIFCCCCSGKKGNHWRQDCIDDRSRPGAVPPSAVLFRATSRPRSEQDALRAAHTDFRRAQCGVGIAFSIADPQNGSLVVKGFVPSGPAAANGTIQKGDVLVEVGLPAASRVMCLVAARPACASEKGHRIAG